MEERIIKMFNDITAADYYISNPYSSACNKAFKHIFHSKDFLKYFYLLSNKTYERLAIIAKVAEDSTKNTVFVTGFRGCGKTCFMNLLNSVVNSEYELPTYDETKVNECEMLQRIMLDKSNEEIERMEDRYSNSSRKIRHTIQMQMRLKKLEVTEQNYSKYLNSSLTGKSIFLNFETGRASNDELPFDRKFTLKIEEVIDEIIRKKKKNEKNTLFAKINDLYSENTILFNNTFEHKNTLLSFFDFCRESLLSCNSLSEVKRELNEVLERLNLEQLLCILVLLHSVIEIDKEDVNAEESKIFFILDNMDIVYRHNILEESMHEYSNFIENMNSLMEELEKTESKRWSNIYNNMTFVFAMRETTAMQISDHFIDGVDFVAKYFDISMDIDKALVVEKKYQFIEKYEEYIENDEFKKTISRIHNICTDTYVKSNVFPMFNNDYKRAIVCIATICENNEELIDQEIELVKTGSDFNKNGARGIIFRVIFDEFMSKRYFQKIGMEPPVNHEQDFTTARPILTLLYNLLPEYDRDQSYNEENNRLTPETISLKRLYKLCKPIVGKKRFIEALVGMFSLKKAPTWNHLITFDNIKKVTYEELDEYLTNIDQEKLSQKADIEIRITCAGANYIKFICTHFEFFSCRYTKRTYPLFAEKNTQYSSKYENYEFEYVLENVFNAVVECCSNLEKYNGKVVEYQKSIGGTSLLQSEYVFKNKDDNRGRLHEERIIHWHIRYIDNYRMHIIKDVYPDKVQEMNEKIIFYIKKYVELLTKPLMSDMSSVLNEELLACIKYIAEVRKYEDSTTQISRSSYKQLVKEGLISE